MAGMLPQNRGNKSAKRYGPIVSRFLRKGDINVSPAARKYRYNGIFVSAQEDHISVLVDLGAPGRNDRAAREIAALLEGWAKVTNVQVQKSTNTESVFVWATYTG